MKFRCLMLAATAATALSCQVLGAGSSGGGQPLIGGTDFTPIGNASDRLKTSADVVSSVLPTGAATAANQSTEITALQIIDNIAHAENSALNNGVPLMGQLDDTATGAVTENNVGVLRMTSDRALNISIKGGQTYTRVTGNTTTTVRTGRGYLHGIIIADNRTGGQVTLYDNTAGSGTIIMQLEIGTPGGGILNPGSGSPGPNFVGPLGLNYTTGLTVVTSGSTTNDITILDSVN